MLLGWSVLLRFLAWFLHIVENNSCGKKKKITLNVVGSSLFEHCLRTARAVCGMT